MAKKAVVIEGEEMVGGEIAASLYSSIRPRVESIRFHKQQIVELEQTSGIAERQAEIERLRGELLDLCRQFNELTSGNWQDDDGFARYVHAGASHKYPTPTVDEVSAALSSLVAEADSFAVDIPIRYTLDMEGERVVASLDDLKEVKAFGKAEVLTALAQEREERIKMAQEINLRLEAMNTLLVKLAGSRKTTTTPEGVAIR